MTGPDNPHASDPPVQPNYYAILGVDRDASTADISRAFRVLARGHHPDLHPGDAHATERFRQFAVAYQVLTDPARRAAYDRHHRATPPRHPDAATPDPPVHLSVRISEPEHEPPLRAGPVHHTPASWKGTPCR